MARTNMAATAVKPEVAETLRLQVLRRTEVSPHMARVTLGGGDVDRFRSMGFDQWFRLFIPVSDDSLDHVPPVFTRIAWAKLLAAPKASRPVVRNYTVRAHRALGTDGPEIDVDVVLHGEGDDAGPGSTWARTCAPGDPVAILDEGIGFVPPPATAGRTVLVADESGLPAAAGILASLPADAEGLALLEVPAEADRQDLAPPPGVEVRWIVRTDPHDVPGRAAAALAQAQALPDGPFYGWTVGEQALPTGVRRHWVRTGVPKDHIMFCGYWKV
ncbi:siderophore-interacting protein [Pseudonocardia broussonetiae]|nr:siderophore-interacting protein [Pseudonocardia broussonetiae]